jgi:AraC-like DNA-binding protein
MNLLQILTDIIINAGIAHGFLISILLTSRTRHQSNLLLSLLLIDLSLVIFRIHYLSPYLWERFGSPFLGTGPFIFLLGPLLYFYLRSIVIQNYRLEKRDSLHLIFFVVYLVILIPRFALGKNSDYEFFLQKFIGSPWIFLILQFGYYLIKTRNLKNLHQTNIQGAFSNVDRMDVSWLNLIIWTFIVIFLFIAIATPWLIHGLNLSSYYAISAVFFSLVSFFIAFRGFQQKVSIPTSTNANVEPKGYSQDLAQMKEQLLAYMEQNKPYLDPELTLVDLAKQVTMSRNQLSQVINNGIGDNFYNFVNKFRVEEVKTLIKNDAGKQYTLMSLANDAGFNSKSSFHKIFKKMTGLTPSQYRDGQN